MREAPTDVLIAPCGLYCGLCHRHCQSETPCEGCRGGRGQSPHCQNCDMLACCTSRGLSSCALCPDAPCDKVRDFNQYYIRRFGFAFLPNLMLLREQGEEALLERIRRDWLCPDCGGVICVHDAKCTECGSEKPRLILRLMQPEDHAALMELWLRTPGMGLNQQDDSAAGLARYLHRNPSTSFVAEEGGMLLGEIMAGHDGRRGEIHHTAVREDARGRGIGRALVEAALNALKAEGIRKVHLVAFARNALGNAFWESMGFTAREDLVYRDFTLLPIDRMDT